MDIYKKILHFLFFFSLTFDDLNGTQAVIELNDKFLQVKHEGLWFVEFYAPWCAHCKRLMPIWEHVGHSLADRDSPVRVAKLDCTRFTSAASALNIRAYPTIIFFRNGQTIIYEGQRKKEELIEFALKASGPLITSIRSASDFSKIRQSLTEPFFVYTHTTEEDELYNEYSKIAESSFSQISFYSSPPSFLPDSINISSTPIVMVFKDDIFNSFDKKTEQTLSSWISAERWPLIPLVTSVNIKDVGLTRLLVLSVINMIDRNNLSTAVGRFQSSMVQVAKEIRAHPRLSSHYQFGWLDGNEIVNSIVLGIVHQPDFLVFNVSSYEYYVSGDIISQMTVASTVSFLERIINGDVQALGGRSVSQRAKRIVYEITTNIREMFKAQPLLTVSLFGVPLAFLSLITYCLCSNDFSIDRDEVYPEDDDATDISDLEEHEKAD